MNDNEERRVEIRRADDVKQALAEREVELLREKLDALEKKVQVLTEDRDKALRWGIMTLGAMVAGMGLWIFNLVAAKTGIGR